MPVCMKLRVLKTKFYFYLTPSVIVLFLWSLEVDIVNNDVNNAYNVGNKYVILQLRL